MTTIAVLEPRDVPLGGYRAITVRRTLPHIERTSVGPFIFADHFGPTEPAMDVAPHPHTHLATCTWLFSGRVRHDDSAGHHLDVIPGDTVLMVAGNGIAHSEYSWPDGPDLHGVQLWLGYPTDERHADRGLHHFTTRAVTHGGVTARVFLGGLSGEVGGEVGGVDADFGSSPIPAPRRALAAELRMEPGAVLILLAGAPYGEDLLMFWNFVGEDESAVRSAREDWENAETRATRFGVVEGYPGFDGEPTPAQIDRIPAPPMPSVKLRPRRNK